MKREFSILDKVIIDDTSDKDVAVCVTIRKHGEYISERQKSSYEDVYKNGRNRCIQLMMNSIIENGFSSLSKSDKETFIKELAYWIDTRLENERN